MCRGQQQGRYLGEAQGSDEVESQNRARTMDFHFLLRADSAPVDDIPADASSFKEFSVNIGNARYGVQTC